MARKIGEVEVQYIPSKRDFSNVWCEYGSSTQLLPKGWQRDPDRRALPEAIIWEKDVAIPLRDGVRLRADVFRPARLQGQPVPALLPWSPYGKTGTGSYLTTNFEFLGIPKNSLSGLEKFEAPDPAEWCARGYSIVNVDSRGAFKSEGDILWFGTEEGKDGYDTIEWIAKQEWCNGSVATVGNSWLGISQWYALFTAAEKPPHLKAMAPWEGLGDFYRETLCRGGIPNPLFWDLLGQCLEGEHLREDVIGMLEKYPHMNAYWEDKKAQIQNIKIPMYALASYSSCLHTEGSIRGWKYSSSTEKWLRVHPTQEWFDIYSSEATDDLQRFLDHYLLGKDNGWEFTPKVRISLLRYNAPPIINRAEDNYPPSRTKYETFYLDCDAGKLTKSPPKVESETSYQSDTWEDDGSHFTYTFDKHTELCGFSKVKLYMSCDELDDMDVYVIIRKLDADGQALLHYNIPFINQKPHTRPEDIDHINVYKYVGPNGRLRASKREIAEEPGLTSDMRKSRDPTEVWYPYYKTAKVPKGNIVELEIAIWPGGMVFEAGESMRLEIKGHDPVLPERPDMEKKMTNQNVGRHKIHGGGKYPSQLIAPLLS
ncbi:hypothetical protein PV08_06409 [Exophiala spinifera]|uniref:Xaa-Pro dipeptidyl-peptidase C-terminal domain-containing protein n=1 Tax=Exophiala spinifera TaxID=91928 RepID=A0A0D2BBH3_9EURO|nr:uncharacterized protein PV08_06409 [Exophiala spinifera]KIW16358.1 hypothetical protein PV08_06409 [Exophiala spinifera]